MDTGITKAVKDGNGNTIIYTALIAAAIANFTPTPFDAIYFSRQQKLKEQLEKGEISVEKYWWHDVGGYYIYTSAWYVALFGILYAMNNSAKRNTKILAGLVGVGVVAGVVARNIKKDKDIAELHKNLSANKQPDTVGG